MYGPEMWTSSGTGRTDGRKLNSPTLEMLSQSARSRALATAVDNPMRRSVRPGTDEEHFRRLHIGIHGTSFHLVGFS